MTKAHALPMVTSGAASAIATEDDIYYAYRLLLGREPDAIGWESHVNTLATEPMKPIDLARHFMSSPEFEARGAGRAAANPDVPSILEIPMDGFSIFVRSDDRDIGHHVRALHSYEPHVTKALRDLLRPGMTFVDVGANLGIFTNMAATLVGPNGLVIAVEPLDKNLQLLYRALSRNGLDNVRVYACAAGERVGLISILTDPGTSNGQPLPSVAADPRLLFTQTKRLDDLTAGIDRMDVVKFDIDGFELIAWRGFREQLAKFRPSVLTEFHPYGMEKFVKVDPLDYLAELFAYGIVHVLSQDRGFPRIPCATAEAVMRHWKTVNGSGGGTVHLDLMITPKR
jgi:FkbM family methyltransferase